jgi:hypothetical protein
MHRRCRCRYVYICICSFASGREAQWMYVCMQREDSRWREAKRDNRLAAYVGRLGQSHYFVNVVRAGHVFPMRPPFSPRWCHGLYISVISIRLRFGVRMASQAALKKQQGGF